MTSAVSSQPAASRASFNVRQRASASSIVAKPALRS